MKTTTKIILTVLALFVLVSCNNAVSTVQYGNEAESAERLSTAPRFNVDSAFAFIQAQVDFGPRVPNTEAHEKCAVFLANELRRHGAEVIEQRANLVAFDGTILRAVNIIGSFNLEQETRVLLFAHWDTRPYADEDPDVANRREPVLGANDGGSGVGVLLEIARLIGQTPPDVGIDIIFFDAEDYGQPYFHPGPRLQDTWALGSQHWARNPHVPGYRARFGIMLCMVGARNANFLREQVSMRYAPHVMDRVWAKAQSLGFGEFFQDRPGGFIINDHLYVNRIAFIPSINIIDFDNGFFDYWHTVNDTMEHICKDVLTAVGQTVLEIIFEERP